MGFSIENILLMQINLRLLTNKVTQRVLCKIWIKNNSNHGAKAMFFPEHEEHCLKPRKCPKIKPAIVKSRNGILGP
jgi:hypothetical protein